MKELWRLIQQNVGVDADGIPGPKTAQALMKKLDIQPPAHAWPSQAEVRSGNSMFGRAGDERSLTNIRLPYVMRIAWEPERTVSTMRCHKMVADPLTRIFQAALDHYGMEKIREMGLDLYGGCFNDRAIIGGKATSMHAWGIAVDMDPDRNGLNTHSPNAVFSRPDYAAFWEIVEAEGAVSLGRARDYDWMHFQFATL
ncbi:hypothetical protein [Akkermansia sp.]|nr:hypothetical protein [Akkermansia sp.]MEE0765428.1 hypothetical protein [Akkermansia sp.]